MRKIDTIILKGWYGQKNLGDDLLLDAVVEVLECKNVRLMLWCKPAKYVKNQFPRIKTLGLINRVILGRAVLIYGGGTQFFSYIGQHKQRIQLRYIAKLLMSPSRIFRLPFSIWNLLVARAITKSVSRSVISTGALAVGVGPFKGKEEDISAQVLELRNIDWIYPRDDLSLSECKVRKVETFGLGSDMVFLSSKLVFNTKPYPAKRKILIIPRQTVVDSNWSAWSDSMVKWGSQLRALGYDVTVLSFCEDDRVETEKIARLCDGQYWHWEPSNKSIEDVIRVFSDSHAVISARYHGALLSAIAFKNTAILGLEDKQMSLVRDLPEIKVVRYPDDDSFVKYLLEEPSPEQLQSRVDAVNKMRERANQMKNDFYKYLEALTNE